MSSGNSPFSLRPTSETEAETLAAIHKECFPNYWNINAFNDFFATQGTLALMAEAPHPVGMIVYRAAHEQADIITIAVLPAHRRQGIARALLEAALQQLSALGVEQLFLDVEDGNDPALRLYEKYGFSEVRRRKNYYRQKDGLCTDALVMACKLK